MKKHYLNRILLAFIALFGYLQTQAVQLSGTYTINPLATATTTNFQNIRSAVTYMTSTGARADGGPANSGTVGVSGPVEFIISAGTFNEQVNIPAITGSSTTNNIIFRGAGRTSTIFTFASTDANNRHTLRLNLATNVTFRDMTIRGTGTNAWVVHIMGLNSNNNKIKNCNVEVTGTGATSTSTAHIAIVINNSATSATTGTRIDGTEIDSNTILNGYYGIIAPGAASNLHLGMKIRNNQILLSFYYGIYLNYHNGIEIVSNNIEGRPSNLYNMGIYMLNSSCTAPNRHIITHNRIINIGQYGVYFSAVSNLSGNKGLFTNNVIGGQTKYEYCRTFYATTSNQWMIANNTFNHDLAGFSNQYTAVYFNSGTGISFTNNICAEMQPGPGLPFYATSTGIFDTLNFNSYYRADTSNGVLLYLGSNYNSGNFIGALGFNTNSQFAEPAFISTTNFSSTNSCLIGTSLPYVIDDYNRNARSVPPSIGAFEIPKLGNNMQVLRVTAPTPPVSSGLNDLVVLVKNAGTNTITSFDLSYLHNGDTTPVTTSWFGTLASCDTVSVTFTGSQQVDIVSVNYLKIFSSNPNSGIDSLRTNDTITRSFFLPMSGTYHVGGNTPDFAKPSDAVSALSTAGMAGPVTILIHPGTYVDQFAFNSAIIGHDSINTITIRGTNKDSCIILHTDAFGDRAIVRLGVSHISVTDLTLRSTNASAAWGVHLSTNNTKNIKIKHCNIELIHPNAYTTTGDTYNGIVASGSTNSLYYSAAAFSISDVEIDSNYILNGYSGIWFYSYYYGYYFTPVPHYNIKLRGNKVMNNYYMGIHFQFIDGFEVSSNEVNMRKDYEYSYGLYMYYCPQTGSRNAIMNNNKVLNCGYTDLYIYNINNPSGNRGQMINNEFAGGYRAPTAYPVQLQSINNFDIYHNSIVHNGLGTSTTAAAFYLSGGSGNRIRNNHFAVTNPATVAPPVYISSGTYTQLNYNNYYKPDTNGNYVFIGSWLTRSGFIGAGGFNINSITVNPGFVNDTTLIPSSGCFNGDTISIVTNDRMGNVRGTIPDIGAIEIPAPANDLSISSLLQPKFPIISGLSDVTVRIINNGNNTITSADVAYRFNGGTPVVQSWGGVLTPCDTTSVNFNGTNQISIAPASVNTLQVYTASPNSLADGNPNNDSLTITVATPMNGNYIIGNAPSNFLTLNQAKAALELRGVDSAVVFLIKTGIYNEQVTFNNILGASETNTITFTSLANHVDSVTIRSNATSASNNFIITLQGARYFRFDKITMQAQSSSFARIIQINGSSSFNEVVNCKLISPVVTTTSTNNAMIYGTPISGGFNRFVKNTMTGGSEVFYIWGTSTAVLTDGFVIDSNTMTNQYYRGGYFYYTANLKIRNNNISTNSAYTTFYGILSYYGDSALEITNNRVYSTTANGYGITTYYSDGFGTKVGIVANNIIRIGTGGTSTNRAISDWYSSNLLIAHNTAVVNGSSATAAHAGYFYYTGSISNTTRIRNNIFTNISTGNVYYYYNTTFGSSDYNVIWGTGTTLFQRGTPANTYANLGLFKTAITNHERNSIQYRPGINTTTLLPVASDTAVWSINGRAVFLPEVMTDYNGNSRVDNITLGVRDIGAYEVTPTSVPPICVATPVVPVAGGTQVFTFGFDTVATINHDAFSIAPDFVQMRQYTGTKPPFVTDPAFHLNMYISAVAPAGFYAYTMNMKYKNEWLGTVPSETDMRLAYKTPGVSWTGLTSFASTTDSIINTMSAPFMTQYDILYTGTDDLSPLPVQMLSFNGLKSNNDVVLNWSTSSEINSKSFEIERSYDMVGFEKVGSVSAKGSANQGANYLFEDVAALSSKDVVYYRLKMMDNDGSFEYSNTIRVSGEKSLSTISVGPNPFKNKFTINNVNENDKVEVMDINGRVIISEIAKNTTEMVISLPNGTVSGIYFLKVSGKNNVITKLIRQ